MKRTLRSPSPPLAVLASRRPAPAAATLNVVTSIPDLADW